MDKDRIEELEFKIIDLIGHHYDGAPLVDYAEEVPLLLIEVLRTCLLSIKNHDVREVLIGAIPEEVTLMLEQVRRDRQGADH